MNIEELQKLLDSYLQWYKQKTKLKEYATGGEIITPFTNHLNDRISIFVERIADNKYRLSDDGMTMNELSLMSLTLNSPNRQKTFDRTLRNFNIKLDGEVLYTVVNNMNEFAQNKHNLVQCIIRLYDLLFTNTQKGKSLFYEEVLDFFFDNDFAGNTNPKFTGQSGLIHSFDYSLGATKKRPTTLIRFQNNPDFTSIAAQEFVLKDIQKEPVLSEHGIRYAIITGKKEIGIKAQQTADYLGIQTVHYENKSKLLQLKESA